MNTKDAAAARVLIGGPLNGRLVLGRHRNS